MSSFDTLCGLVMPSGRTWGAVATDQQQRDARAVLSKRGPRRHWIGRPRGYSKTEDLGALTTVALIEVLPPDSEAYACARDRDQSRILLDRVRGFIRRSGLDGLFASVGPYVITTRSGIRLEALSCDVGSAWGLSPAWVVVDELCQWPETPAARELFDAVMTGLPKVRGSRATVISTSGSPGHWSRAVFDRAERERSWGVSMIGSSPPWMDPAEIAEAERNLPASTFARLFHNVWAQGEDRLFDPDDVAACTVLAGPGEYVTGSRYCLGVDLALRNDRAAVAVGHLDGYDGTAPLTIDRLDTFTPDRKRDVDLQRVEDLIAVRSKQFGNAPAVFDPAGAWQMMQRLQRRGVRTIEHTFSAGSNSRRTLLLLQLVREHRLRIPDDQELIDEMLNLRVREVQPGSFRYDHDASKHDDRVTAVSLVADHLLSKLGGPSETLLATGNLPRITDSGPQLTFADGSRRRIGLGSVQDQLGGRR
jgi:phage terminase large subunit-like protein